ncbi:glycosyl hydrolase family 18 protein [uncultured Photobacterium sp.]|uniref:glycosyl hydrolase family 18 protein n=1 Tax=uncultured Photobacterium sp. TaxID=173973 RepID=UPI00260A028F|nr:glycosyl hydrolase family 18 protein [uncultured Photobacterium sp.]
MKWKLSETCKCVALPLALALGCNVVVASEPSDYFTGQHDKFKQTSGKVVASYVANWANPAIVDSVYGNNLTHVLYAFMHICGPGQIASVNEICSKKNDFELAEDTNSIDKTFAAKFSDLKKRAPHIKVIPSVGGWGGSAPFVPMTATAEIRQVFIQSVVDYLKRNPSFDGIDIDWEWPQNPKEGEAYADLMIEMRNAFDLLEQDTGRKYLITSAIGTHTNNIQNVNYVRAEPYMDYIFMMTYDFFGAWSKANIGHHTALQLHESNLAKGYGHSGGQGIKNMQDLGIPAEKLVLGVAMYARGWDGVTRSPEGAEIGGTATGLFPKPVNPWDEAGVAIYKRVAAEILGPDGTGINGFEIHYDRDCDCHYAWRESDGAFVGFDHPKDVQNKGHYVVANNLAGVFSWEYGQDNGDILNAMNHGVGNVLEANKFPAWDAETVFYKGDKVVYQGDLYIAKWWTLNNEPGNVHGPWKLLLN